MRTALRFAVDQIVKKVSFGEQQIKTFEVSRENDSQQLEIERGRLLGGDMGKKQPFTASDAAPSRVTVTTEQSEFPRPISPPAQLESPQHYHHHYQQHQHPGIASPPLPALVQRMDGERGHENPFRPEETLYHEVDPIVEAYKTKPYPPSPTHSPLGSPIKSSLSYAHNGLSKEALLGGGNKSKQSSSSIKRNNNDLHDYSHNNEYSPMTDGPEAKAGRVELVHIDKKKRCGCCSLQ